MTTYPKMNKEIVKMLNFRGDTVSIYAAGRIEELEAKMEDLRGLLQGVRTSLELASELLAPPGPMAARAQCFVEEALEAVIEELD